VGIGYLFVSGGFIFVGLSNLNFGMNFGLEDTFVINLAAESSYFQLRINVLVLALFMYLIDVFKKISNEYLALEVIQERIKYRLATIKP
jgi:hypothetical protein